MGPISAPAPSPTVRCEAAAPVVLIFFGAALLLGSPVALVVTALHIPLMDRFIRREERQLERHFGDEWRSYKRRVRRWL